MKSTIRVEYDFDEKSPYLQMRLEGHDEENGDFKDKLLQNFIEESNCANLKLEYRGGGNYVPQIRIIKEGKQCISPTDFYSTINWVGLNATSISDQGPVYKAGKSYNLKFATGCDHSVGIKTLGEEDILVYEFLSDFTEKWIINPAKRS